MVLLVLFIVALLQMSELVIVEEDFGLGGDLFASLTALFLFFGFPQIPQRPLTINGISFG